MNSSGVKKSAYFVRKDNNTAKPVSPAANNDKSSSQNVNSKSPESNSTGILSIPGTRTSLQNNQLLTPFGIPTIDSFIGGGLPVGSLCLIGQDTYNSFSDIIVRSFIAEGIVHRHSIYVADPNENENHFFQVN
jgi:hypothetical protein